VTIHPDTSAQRPRRLLRGFVAGGEWRIDQATDNIIRTRGSADGCAMSAAAIERATERLPVVPATGYQSV